MKHAIFFRFAFGFAALVAANVFAQAPDHVVIVIMENHSFSQIIGSPDAPAINALAGEGANFVTASNDPTAARTGSHSLRHPSQPNYLELYSGDNQGTLMDGFPGSSAEPLAPVPPFSAPNLGASLLHAGFTFTTYSEDLPAVGSDVESSSDDATLTKYERKHNPAVNWQAADAGLTNTHLPPALNQPFFPLPGQPATGFPSDFTALPTVSIVVPNQQHDMHDGTVAQGDAWVKTNIIDTYLAWAKKHNSLLILTFDEDGDNTASNQIPTIFAGPMIKPGIYTEADININNPDARTPNGLITPTGTAMNHYNVLATVEDLYGLTHIGGSANRPGISDVFVTPALTKPIVAPNELSGKQGDVGNLFPLFAAQPIRYQQVYASNQFTRLAAGGEQINSVAFRVHAPDVPFTGSVPQLQVNLSTTSRTPDNLSSVFSENVGTDDTQVFSGPLQVSSTGLHSPDGPENFEIVITFSQPFLYDPSKGNLLLDIRNAQGGTETPPLDQELDASSAAGDGVSRVYNYGDAAAPAAGKTGGADENDSLGLVTQFGTSANPAPSPTPSPTPTPSGTVGPRNLFLNSSTRAITSGGNDVMIGGFIIQGNAAKKVVVRGLGPSISIGGMPVPGTIQDPVLELHKEDGSVLAANDDWKQTQMSDIQATGLAPNDNRESAIVISLSPGNYTAIVSNKDGTSGIALVEVYDVEQSSAGQIYNISTRAHVDTGDNVMIGGFIVGGPDSARGIVRGLGPSINVNGVPVPGTLADPTLELHDGNGALLAFNDNWKDSQQAEIEQSGLAPTDDREAAIIGSFAPGQYTVILRGKNDTTGIGLFEAYKLN
jgi:hypothetical protein